VSPERGRILGPAAVACLLAATVARAGSPAHLVRDINGTVVNALPSEPKLPAIAGGRLFFSALTFDGIEPWTSDGTEAGTTLLRDVFPGGSSSQPGRFADFAGAVFFPAESGGHGRQIWRTDGTTAGTVRVTDRPWTTLGDAPWVASGGRLFFVARTPETGLELWSTDGTDAGTALVKDIQPGPAHSFVFEMIDLGGRLVFGADDGTHGRELWTSDGTTAGTVLLADLNPADSSFPRELTAFAGRVCFTAMTAASGWEPWCTDGTAAGTSLLKDVAPGPASSSATYLKVAGGQLFFSARGPAGEGAELWTSDGTAAGTRQVADIAPGPAESFPSDLAAVGDAVLFSANDGTTGREMWRSDGTAAGTVRVADIAPGGPGSAPELLTASGGRVYFTASRSDVGREPWVTDGTPAGTRLVADIAAGAASSVGSGPVPSQYLVGLAGNAFLVADDGQGRELWRLEPQSATLLRPRGGWARSSVAFDGHEVGGRLVFAADDGTGREPWSSDGTSAGTFRLKDICVAPCTDAGGPGAGAVIDGVLYFSASDHEHGRELWRTDGTQDGTRLFLDLSPGPAGTSPRGAIAAGSRLFFSPMDGSFPESGGLWAVETPTAAATRVGPYSWEGGGSDPLGADLNGRLVTVAMSSPFLPSVYRSDGTVAGTETLRRLAPGSLTGSFHVAAGIAFFAAGDGNGRELWRTDGTIEGTRLVRDICPGPCASLPTDIPSAAVAGTLLFFAATDDAHGDEVWVSDGTFDGTRLLKDVRPGVGGSSPGPFETLNGIVYWPATDDAHGRELWRSDGTEAGTFLVKDVEPGTDWGLPAYQAGLLNVGDRLLFSGCRPPTGCELWETDGTSAGTRLLQEFWPGPVGGYGVPLGVAGGFAYVGASEPATGYEPWALPIGARASVGDAHVIEGDGAGGVLRFDVRVDGPVPRASVVTYETRPGTAASGADFTPAAGAVTFFPGGPAVQTVTVPVGGDLAHEGDETLWLQLTGGTVLLRDARGDAVIEDDDGPRVEAAGGGAPEGNAGSTPLTVSVRLRTKDGAPTALSAAVQWQTESGTASAGQDFTAADGLVTFPAGTPDGSALPVAAQVLGDTLDEPDEAFQVVFRPASTSSGAPAGAHAAIVDDDGVASGPALELAHGSRLRAAAAADGVGDWLVVHQAPRSSYEAVVQDVSGDLQPIRLSRRDAHGPSPTQTSVGLGTGQVQTLRWTAFEPPEDGGMLRLEGDACAPSCGADDQFAVRLYDTTVAVPRILNAGTNRTFVILFNSTDRAVQGNVTCWNASGSVVGSWSVSLAARASAVQDSSIACAAGASATITHDAGYGGLVGKAVTADAVRGLSFDTPLTVRPR
jgi:ELWxxDGT repeat protein